jgi:hypothetical protein
MTIAEAIEIVRNPKASFQKCVEATGVLADSEDTPLEYLVECLSRGGLPSEIAAMKLYKRTNRPGPDSPAKFIADRENWSAYLQQVQKTLG